MSGWYYLSFAGDDGFLGGAYVQGESSKDAYFNATTSGVNPGGEVQILGPLPPEEMDENVPEEKRGRLLSREEVE